MFAADLVIATLTISTLSLIAFLLGRRVRSNCKALFICTIFTTVIFSIWFQGNLGWANLVPFSSAVLLANFTPILVSFVVGFACNGLELRKRTRPAIVSVLALLAVVCLFAPIIRPAIAPPEVSAIGKMKGIVVLQSHDATCAPASAATLLRLHGFDSSEKDMVGPCLTSEFGTEALGLYRGIKIGCREAESVVRIANRDPQHWLQESQLPNVALVRFQDQEFEGLAEIHEREKNFDRPNWFAGTSDAEDGHAVVIVDYSDGKWTVADPAIGLVKWSNEELAARFTGDAIYISTQ